MTSAGLKRAVAFGAIVALLGATPSFAAATDVKRARVAARYVALQQEDDGSVVTFSTIGSTADAVMSFVAVRRGAGALKKAVGFLRGEVEAGHVTTVGAASKVVLAAYAAGKDPSTFGGTDLVGLIEAAEDVDGRFGDSEYSYVYDQALALLALDAAGVTPSTAAVTWLEEAQCGDGGWQFDHPPTINEDASCYDAGSGTDYNTSDTNSTAMAIQALEVSGGTGTVVDDGFDYLVALRDEVYGGWGYAASFSDTDANSTALVIQAYSSAVRGLPGGVMRALRSLQYRLCGAEGGAFGFTFAEGAKTARDTGATIAGMVGLTKQALPIQPAPVTKPVPHFVKCD